MQCGIAAVGAAWLLSGCAVARAPLEALELPRTPEVEGGAWPRLADAPAAETSPGAAPDPADGRATAARLQVEAAAGAAEAERLGAGPVVAPGESAALRRAAGG
ncbi:MAG: hypothetical protein AAF676_12420 [Pseudomonadota bacterium]